MRIKKLDGLRGVFSIMIVLLHYKLLPPYLYNNFLIRQSYIYVDFFFVLSGFVISYNYNQINTYKQFRIYLKKRFIRLYPLLFYTVTLCLLYHFTTNYIIKVFFPNINVFKNTTPLELTPLLLQYLDSILFTNSIFINSGSGGLNGPSWSISSEMISYTVFGVLSLYFMGTKKNLILFSIILISTCFLFNHGDYFPTGDYGFVRGLISFNLGYFVWKISRKEFKIHPLFEYLNLIGLITILYALNSNKIGHYNYQILCGSVPFLFSIFILVFIKSKGTISRFLESKPIQHIGKISYSIYLNHTLTTLIVTKTIFSIIKIEQSNLNQILVFLITTLIIIFYSNITYNYIELKTGKTLRKHFKI